MWDLIVSVPDRCLSFYFSWLQRIDINLLISSWTKIKFTKI